MKNMQFSNTVELEVSGAYALFSNPIFRVSGEKRTYSIPTYEAIKGVLMSVYWKPTFIWVIDKVRVMNLIQTEPKGIRLLKYNNNSTDLAYYTYLKDCKYQIQAHFFWNENRTEFKNDRNEHKHFDIAKRSIQKGGRRDVFLGTRDCQAYVKPCVFGEGEGAYDNSGMIDFGIMYHGLTYPDEAYSDETTNCLTANFWNATMENGIISFLSPEDCPYHEYKRDMIMKHFNV